MSNLSISISIVVYKPKLNVLDKSLYSLNHAVKRVQNKLPSSFSIFIVDNASGKEWEDKINDSFEKFQSYSSSYFKLCEFIQSKKNLGYGGGHNLAIDKIETKYHLIMNPDVFLFEDTLLNAINYMENHTDIGLLIPDVLGENGERHFLCKKNPTIFDMYLRSFAPSHLKMLFNERMKNFEMRYQDYNRDILNVPFPTGCFMFMRVFELKIIKGFDPKFFLYFEDADLGRRLLQISKTIYAPQVKIIHKWERGSHYNYKLKLSMLKSAYIYFKKWGGIF